ncbi:MAG: efflux RND transporter periplasmic adaptor subunit [Gammaproteobacteria bacterium]|nr:efflux RND transporter periplasmic adaptor subunit [Gammaproteobacteria bacterium]
MKRVIGVAQILIVLGLVTIASLIACRATTSSDSTPSFAMGPPVGTQAPQITVAIVRPDIISATVEVDATGSIAYRTAVSIVPQVGGRVTWVSPALRNGGEFEAGETVFKLDPIDAELSVRQAKADLAVALAEMHLANAQRDAATENYQLLNPGAEVPPLVAQEPQIDRSQAAIDRAKARLLAAELALSRTEFSFPFSGRVLTSNVGVGQLLAMNQPVGQVYDINELEAVIPVSTMDLDALEPIKGRRALLETDHGYVEAIVERQSAALDERTRASALYAKVHTTDHDLAPGSFIRAKIFGRQIDQAYVLPEETEQAKSTVWVVRDGLLIRQEIQIHDRREDGLLVSTFPYYEGIVTGSMPNVEEGDPVRIARMPQI